MALGGEGVLESVLLIGDRLVLTMKYKGRESIGGRQWDAPQQWSPSRGCSTPTLGKPTTTIGDLNV